MRFGDEVARFRRWAAAEHPDADGGEWECTYPDWVVLRRAAAEVIGRGGWTDAERADLLYVIARDNEYELVIDMIDPADLLPLAEAARTGGERDARWQLADRLPKAAARDQVERALIRFVEEDPDEYVRRRALGALGRVGSAEVERLALRLWELDGEDQRWTRMMVLQVLHERGSPHLARLRDEALADPRPELSEFARKLS